MSNKHYADNISFHNETHLGASGTSIVLGVHEEGKTTFTLDDAQEMTSLTRQSLRNELHRLQQAGLISRLENGLYNLVPFEVGRSKEYLGNPYIVARELLKKKLKSEDPQYYISHGSAMDIHQMITQPQFTIFVTTNKQLNKKSILGTDFKFITTKKDYFFGFKKHWITPSESVLVSNLERTVIDGLKSPEHCGGIVEVAKGIWIKKDTINIDQLVSYAAQINNSAVSGRLGFILETYGLLNEVHGSFLKKQLRKSYAFLDPMSLGEGKYMSDWKLRINISANELRAIVRT